MDGADLCEQLSHDTIALSLVSAHSEVTDSVQTPLRPIPALRGASDMGSAGVFFLPDREEDWHGEAR